MNKSAPIKKVYGLYIIHTLDRSDPFCAGIHSTLKQAKKHLKSSPDWYSDMGYYKYAVITEIVLDYPSQFQYSESPGEGNIKEYFYAIRYSPEEVGVNESQCAVVRIKKPKQFKYNLNFIG